MFTWEKLGRVFNPLDMDQDIPWLKNYAQAPSVVIFDNFVRIYFSCRPHPDDRGQFVSYSAYIDVDRNNLFKLRGISEKPILDLGQRGTFDEFGTYPSSVIKDKDVFKVYYGGWTRCQSVPFDVSIGYGESKDGGKTFVKLGNGPILSSSVDEPFILSGPKIRKFEDKWFLYYIAGKKWIINNERPEPVYRIRMATSEDGLNWIKQNKDLIECKIEDDECQASPDVIFKNNKYHMFFCYRYSKNYRCKEGGYRIGYACSLDGFYWERNDNLVGIDISNDGWDSEMISYPHVFELDGTIYMLYLGNSVGREGFGLAKLRNDLI